MKSKAEDIKMILKLEHGNVEIELFDKIAPNHVKRFKILREGLYNGVVFHGGHRWFYGSNRRCEIR